MANTIHGVFRSDALHDTNASAGLRSAKYFVDDVATDIDNGSVVKLEVLMENERELWKAVAPAEGDDIAKLFVVGTPEVMYDERLRNLTDFYNEAGQPIRCYSLHTGSMFSVTAPVIEGAPAVGQTVGVQGTKWLVGGAGVGTIIAIETVGTLQYVVIRVD